MTSTPTRPVENVVITTKGLQDRNNLLLVGKTVENKGKLILTEIFPSVQKQTWYLKVFKKLKITKIHFDNKQNYKRLKGRPRLKWIDGVEKDMKHAGISNWKQKKLVTERLGNL